MMIEYFTIPSIEFIERALDSLSVYVNYNQLFPPSVDYSQVQNMIEDKVFPTLAGLAPAFSYAIVLSILRYVFHYILFKPLALRSMKMKEVHFHNIKDIDKSLPVQKLGHSRESVLSYCKASGRMEDDVNSYLWSRKRHLLIRKKIVKYVEAFWRAIFYISFSLVGYYALFTPETASWVQDTKNNWIDWPIHTLTPTLKLYYHIELGCYLHQLLWTEVSRSDALEMIVHHLITICLLVFSYLTNFTRIGASILFIHDLADVFLEAAKVFNYTSQAPGHRWMKATVVDGTFALFAVTFFITRLVIYPRFILYSVIVEGVEHFGCNWAGCYIFIGLLLALQCLHIFWFYLIMKMVFRLVKGDMTKDERSDDEEELEEKPSSLVNKAGTDKVDSNNKKKK